MNLSVAITAIAQFPTDCPNFLDLVWRTRRKVSLTSTRTLKAIPYTAFRIFPYTHLYTMRRAQSNLSTIFARGRPTIRPVNLSESDAQPSDIECLWRAYQVQPFFYFGPGLSRKNFARTLEIMSGRIPTWVARSDNTSATKPPILAVATLQNDGWRFVPHVHFLPWASDRDALRVTMASLETVRRSPEIGVCIIYSLAQHRNLFHRCAQYGLLEDHGTFERADPKRTEYVFVVQGRKPTPANAPPLQELIY